MRTRSGRSRRLAAALLVPGLLACLPTIQVCLPTPSDRDAFYHCLLFGPPADSAAPGTPGSACSPHPCASGSCPLMEHRAASAAPCAARERRPVTLCIGDPAAGYGLRSAAPRTPTLDRIALFLPSPAVVGPGPMPAHRARFEFRARPPSRAPDAPAPIRGPPSFA